MPVLTDGSTLSAYYSHLPPLVAILSTSFTLTHTVTQRLRNSGVTRYAYTQLCVNYEVFLDFGSKTAIIILLEFWFSTTMATNLMKHFPSFEFQFRLTNSTTFWISLLKIWISWENKFDLHKWHSSLPQFWITKKCQNSVISFENIGEGFKKSFFQTGQISEILSTSPACNYIFA